MKRTAVRKKQVSADELCWLIHEALGAALGNKVGSSFAVVPDPKNGWRAVQLRRMRKNPELAAAITEIEQQLLRRYTLV